VIICRTRKQSLFTQGVFSNKFIWLGIAAELVLLSIIVYVPFANTFFGTQPLTFFELFLSLPFAVAIFIFDEVRKFLLRRDNHFVKNNLAW